MRVAVFVSVLFLLVSCGGDVVPRSYGYFRVDLPENDYCGLDTLAPYRFDVSKYATVTQAVGANSKYSIDIFYPMVGGKVYCTYDEFDRGEFRRVSEESRELAYKHVVRADAITEQLYVNEQDGVYGILYDLKGNTASGVQFFLTDSVSRCFRGSLYFNARPNSDSIAPMMGYVRKDIVRLMESFKWKE